MRLLHRVARMTLALAALGAVAAPASATTLIRQGLDRLTEENEIVLQGRVLDIHSYWNDERNFVLTDVRVRPARGFKGPVGQEITFTVMGGAVGDITTLIVGGPSLVPGSDYVLFLNRVDLPGAARRLTVRDLSQGVFEVADGPRGRRAFSQALGHPLLPDARGLTEAPGGVEGFALEDLARQILDLVRDQ